MTSLTALRLPIRTRRLQLRDFCDADLAAIHAYASDPRVARFMEWGPNRLEETRVFLDRRLAAQAASPREDLDLAILEAREDRLIGSVALRPFDKAARTMSLGYSLHADVWGQGIAVEAAWALVDAAFQTLGLHRVVATCDVDNVASYRVMEKLGMRREGRFRRDRRVKGAWRDTFLYAVLAQDRPAAPPCP